MSTDRPSISIEAERSTSEPVPKAPSAPVAAAEPLPVPAPVRRSWVRRVALFPLTRILVGGVTCGLAGMGVFALGTPLARFLALPRGMVSDLLALPAAAALLLAYALVIRLLEVRPVSELSRRGVLLEGGGGFLLGLLLVSAMYGVLAAAGAYRVLGAADGRGLLHGFLFIVFFATFEEVIFRGVLYRVIESSLGTVLALVISAALFGAVHADNPGAGHLGAVSAGIAGVWLGLGFTLTRKLWLPIGLHIGWNYAQVIFGTPVSGVTRLAEAAWLRGELVGSELLTGGAYGIENSVVAIALEVAGSAALLALVARNGLFVAPFWKRRAASAQAGERGPDSQSAGVAG